MKNVLICALLVAFSPLNLAAQEFTGNIVGVVSDSTGAVIPGATLTLSSVAIQGTRSTVSDSAGGYRFTLLPPGTYTVTYKLEGFATLIREGVLVGVGRTSTINVAMQVAALSDAVTVTGETPVVDLQSTVRGVNYDSKMLESLPIGSRNLGGVLTTTPGIQVTGFDVGGSLMGTNTGFRSYGLSGQFNVRVDGVSTQELSNNLNLYFDYGALQEMQVSAAGNSAESNVPGAAVNMTVKTGSNQLHSTFYIDWENKNFQSENLTEELKDRGIGVGDKFDRYNDLNVHAGGPIKKDKLWWFYSYRNQSIGLATEMKKPDGNPGAIFTLLLRNNTLKVNYQLNSTSSVFFTGQTGRKRANRGGRGPNAGYYTFDSTGLQNSIVWLNKGQYNKTFGNRATFEAAANGESYDAPYLIPPGVIPTTPIRDLVTNTVRGSYTGDSPGLTTGGLFRDSSRKWQWYGAVSYFTSAHNIKTSYGVVWVDRKSIHHGPLDSPGQPQGVVLYTSNGLPDRFQTQNTPFDYQSSMWQNYFFLQDKWQLTRKLVADVGVRWDRYLSMYPEQGNDGLGVFSVATHFPKRVLPVFNNWVPRLGMIYDLFGNTRTALKFNYGLYSEDPDIAFANSVNPNTTEITNRYAWDGTLPITPELVARSTLLSTSGQFTPSTIDPNIKNSTTDQFLVGVEHQLLPNFALNANWVRTRRLKSRASVNRAQPTEGYAAVAAIDPGPDGLLTTSDDRPFTVYERLVPAGSDIFVTNFKPGEFYDTLEFGATKRFANGSQIITGWDQTKRHLGDTLDADPNLRLYNGANRAVTSQWTYKLLGTYSLHWDSSISGSYTVQKGEPYNRAVQFTSALLVNHPAALRQGNTTVTVEPSGAYYLPTIALTNIRFEKRFKMLAKGHSATAMIELYNIPNSNTIIGINSQTARTTDRNGKNVAQFGRATQILNPRILRLGMRYQF